MSAHSIHGLAILRLAHRRLERHGGRHEAGLRARHGGRGNLRLLLLRHRSNIGGGSRLRAATEHGASALDPEAGEEEGRANASPAHCAEGERARSLGARVEHHHHAVAKHTTAAIRTPPRPDLTIPN